MRLEQAIAELVAAAEANGTVAESLLSDLIDALSIDEVDELLERLPRLNITVSSPTPPAPDGETTPAPFPDPLAILKRRLTLNECHHLQAQLNSKGIKPDFVSYYAALRMKYPQRAAFEEVTHVSRELAWLLFNAEGALGEVWRADRPAKQKKTTSKNLPRRGKQ